MLFVFLFIFSGCLDSAAHKNEDVAAIVRGEEITVGYLRFLYPDNAIVEMTNDVVKAKLAEQEVKEMMNVDISKHVKKVKELYDEYPQDDSAETQSIREFADSQARKFEMEPEAYYKKYTETSVEMAAYVDAYTSALMGELEEDEVGIEDYHHHANEWLDDLAEQNKDDIEIKIK